MPGPRGPVEGLRPDSKRKAWVQDRAHGQDRNPYWAPAARGNKIYFGMSELWRTDKAYAHVKGRKIPLALPLPLRRETKAGALIQTLTFLTPWGRIILVIFCRRGLRHEKISLCALHSPITPSFSMLLFAGHPSNGPDPGLRTPNKASALERKQCKEPAAY